MRSKLWLALALITGMVILVRTDPFCAAQAGQAIPAPQRFSAASDGGLACSLEGRTRPCTFQ
jgi:hypothetical protein